MKEYYTEAEAGSVRIGNDDFTILIPNGYGDCTTTVHVLDKGEELPKFLTFKDFFTSFRGENVKIYEYDCGGDNIVATLSGRFGAYYNDKDVYFMRWE